MVGEIILERRARSNRNGGRHHRGFAGVFPRNPQLSNLPDKSGTDACRRGVYPQLSQSCVRCCRSEEHTSELQSQSNLVCRLLLEKKKNNTHLLTTRALAPSGFLPLRLMAHLLPSISRTVANLHTAAQSCQTVTSRVWPPVPKLPT